MYVARNGELVWQELRSTRSSPLGPAGKVPRRRSVYTAALEQAEQLFGAARRVGVSARPILQFYGLSQAGRAIAAASQSLSDKDYILHGHGIKASNVDGPITSISINTDAKAVGTSFVRLSHTLGSPVWAGGLALRDIWRMLPEAENWPLTVGATSLLLEAVFDELASLSSDTEVHIIVSPVPSDLIPTRGDAHTPALDDFLADYPTLAGYSRVSYAEGWISERGGGVVRLHYPCADTDYMSKLKEVARHVTAYRQGELYAFPKVKETSSTLHPLMAWWSVLYALSMLARYHPDNWTKCISVDHSHAAVATEHLLTVAFDVVPELALRAIREVSNR